MKTLGEEREDFYAKPLCGVPTDFTNPAWVVIGTDGAPWPWLPMSVAGTGGNQVLSFISEKLAWDWITAAKKRLRKTLKFGVVMAPVDVAKATFRKPRTLK